MPKFNAIFGGLVAYIMLGFYVDSTVYAIRSVHCLIQSGCVVYPKNLSAGYVDVLTVIGALVSALVVAELAVTTPGDVPGARLQTGNSPINWASAVTIVYMVVWLGIGVATFVVGYMQHPDTVPALTSSAKSWFGIAAAAVYSYFGIKP
jgi:hypothetical protein